MNAASDRETWMRRILERFEGPLIRHAQRLLGELERARDVTQDCFLKLCQQAQAETWSEAQLNQWLHTVCRNRAVDILRKEGRMVQHDHAWSEDPVDHAPGARLEQDEREAALQRRIATLPERQQRVLTLKFQEGLSYKAIAERLDLSVSHVGVLLHHAIRSLRDQASDISEGVHA